jgi:hypothetical protein
MNKKSKHISTLEAKKIAMKDISEDSTVNYVYNENRIINEITNKINKDIENTYSFKDFTNGKLKGLINKCGNDCKQCKCYGKLNG